MSKNSAIPTLTRTLLRAPPVALRGVRLSADERAVLDLFQELLTLVTLASPASRRSLLAELGVTAPADLSCGRIPKDLEVEADVHGHRFRIFAAIENLPPGVEPENTRRLEGMCSACLCWISIGNIARHVETHLEY